MAALAWAGAATSGRPQPDLEKQFAVTVRPFVQSYCSACHTGEKAQAQLDLTAYTSMASVVRDDPHWSRVLEKLAAKQMPPPSFGKQPSDREREAVIHRNMGYDLKQTVDDWDSFWMLKPPSRLTIWNLQ